MQCVRRVDRDVFAVRGEEEPVSTQVRIYVPSNYSRGGDPRRSRLDRPRHSDLNDRTVSIPDESSRTEAQGVGVYPRNPAGIVQAEDVCIDAANIDR